MKARLLLPLLLLAGIAIPTHAANTSPPQVAFNGKNPELLVLFDKDTDTRLPYSPVTRDPNTGACNAPTPTPTYRGVMQFRQGNWLVDGAGVYTSTSATLRYRTTINGTTAAGGQTPQARDPNKPWVAQIRYKHTGAYGPSTAWSLEHFGVRDLLALRSTGNGDTWQLLAGNAAGWTASGNTFALGTDYNTLTFLYKPNGVGGGSIDFYLNGVVKQQNITLDHNDYALDYIQLQNTGAGTDWFEFVKIGDWADRFGHDWVRNNPFLISALVQCNNSIDFSNTTNLYANAGLTYGLIWEGDINASHINNLGLPWFSRTAPIGAGLHLPDEPKTDQMYIGFETKRNFRRDYPGKPTWGNLSAINTTNPQEHYGCSSTMPSGYSYERHVDDYLDIVNPDILSFDIYPFETSASVTEQELRERMFRNMEVIRNKALTRDVPYFGYVQSWSSNGGMALPSESDVRMQVNALLAYGFKGISYFLWAHKDIPAAIIKVDGSCQITEPSRLYGDVQKLNAEVQRLGKTLKHLKSVSVRYMPGKNSSGTPRALPAGTTAIAFPVACTNGYVTNIERNVHNGNGTEAGDLLLGCFTPEPAYNDTVYAGDNYFMLVNLYRSTAKTSAETQQDIVLHFDFGTSGITGIQRLDPGTGAAADLPLIHDGGSHYRATLTLGGGDELLFKYNNGRPFIGAEPSSANLLSPALMMELLD